MNKDSCPKFEDCSAPLCPLDETSISNGIWYPDEEICKRRDFQNLDWVKKQKAIVKAKARNDRYFTPSMLLQAIKQVRKGIEGINPDQSIENAKQAEKKWIAAKRSGRVVAKQTQKGRRVIAEKRKSLVFAANTSNQEKEVKNDV